MKFRLSLLLCLCFLAPLVSVAEDLLPRPPELEPDIQFWIKVYTQVTTNEGYLHDQHRLSVIYETLHFDADTPRSRTQGPRRGAAHAHRGNPAAPGQRRGSRRTPMSRRYGSCGARTPRRRALPRRLTMCASSSARPIASAPGLMRAGTWETHIGEVLANLGLPAQIAALPHVESSFDPGAYSKVGAAGLWQFMRSTGRRFMRIDPAVDERLDPFRATEAAAQLLNYNYRLLGTWPLAITAYNHGAEGMLRAREQLGTTDIVRILHEYHSPTFRLRFAQLLCVVPGGPDDCAGSGQVLRPLHRGTEPQFVEVKLSSSASSAALVKTLGIDRDTLRSLNPALRPAVWTGQRAVPAGYVLRLPGSSCKVDLGSAGAAAGAVKPRGRRSVTPPANVPAAGRARSGAAAADRRRRRGRRCRHRRRPPRP